MNTWFMATAAGGILGGAHHVWRRYRRERDVELAELSDQPLGGKAFYGVLVLGDGGQVHETTLPLYPTPSADGTKYLLDVYATSTGFQRHLNPWKFYYTAIRILRDPQLGDVPGNRLCTAAVDSKGFALLPSDMVEHLGDTGKRVSEPVGVIGDWNFHDALRVKCAAVGRVVDENKFLSSAVAALITGSVGLLILYSAKRAGVNPSPPQPVPALGGIPMMLPSAGRPPAPPPAVG